MSYPSTLEDLQEDVRSFIDTNYDTYLQGITTQKADGISLTALKSVKISDGNPWEEPEDPVLMLRAEGFEADFLDTGHDEIKLDLTSIILLREGDENMLKRMARYAEAFRQLFRDYHSFAPGFDVDFRSFQSFFYRSVHNNALNRYVITQFSVLKDAER